MADNLTNLPAGSWTEVIGSAPSTFIEFQNVGVCPIQVAIQASAPTEARDGQVYGAGEGHATTSGLNKLYARPLNPGIAGTIETRSA